MTPQLHRRLTKIVAFLTAMRGSALIMVSGEQVGSTEKWTAPAAEARKKNPVAVTESSLTAGQKIYLKRCVACHGKTGNGDGPDATDLGKPRPTPIKSHLIFARLIHAMPPFSLPCSRAITPPSSLTRMAPPHRRWPGGSVRYKQRRFGRANKFLNSRFGWHRSERDHCRLCYERQYSGGGPRTRANPRAIWCLTGPGRSGRQPVRWQRQSCLYE